ncbi:MAG: cation:proton antiporter subunit C [Pseudomonadota bacterium]
MLDFIIAKGGYWVIIALMMTGLYIVFAATNLIKRMVGLSVFQTSVFLFYITLSKVAGGTAPVLYGKDYPVKKDADYGASREGYSAAPDAPPTQAPTPADAGSIGPDLASPIAGADSYADYPGVQEVYSNPLPHVLILTAIVVGVATLAVGLAIIVRIREAYGTIEADEVRALDIVVATAEENEDKSDEAAAPGPGAPA